jgi:hypothetical protein
LNQAQIKFINLQNKASKPSRFLILGLTGNKPAKSRISPFKFFLDFPDEKTEENAKSLVNFLQSECN